MGWNPKALEGVRAVGVGTEGNSLSQRLLAISGLLSHSGGCAHTQRKRRHGDLAHLQEGDKSAAFESFPPPPPPVGPNTSESSGMDGTQNPRTLPHEGQGGLRKAGYHRSNIDAEIDSLTSMLADMENDDSFTSRPRQSYSNTQPTITSPQRSQPSGPRSATAALFATPKVPPAPASYSNGKARLQPVPASYSTALARPPPNVQVRTAQPGPVYGGTSPRQAEQIYSHPAGQGVGQRPSDGTPQGRSGVESGVYSRPVGPPQNQGQAGKVVEAGPVGRYVDPAFAQWSPEPPHPAGCARYTEAGHSPGVMARPSEQAFARKPEFEYSGPPPPRQGHVPSYHSSQPQTQGAGYSIGQQQASIYTPIHQGPSYQPTHTQAPVTGYASGQHQLLNYPQQAQSPRYQPSQVPVSNYYSGHPQASAHGQTLLYTQNKGPPCQSNQSTTPVMGHIPGQPLASTYSQVQPRKMPVTDDIPLATGLAMRPQPGFRQGEVQPIGGMVPGGDYAQHAIQPTGYLEDEVDRLTKKMLQDMNHPPPDDYFGKCSRCGEDVVGEGSGCTAMDQVFHVDCFTCLNCHERLRGQPFYSVDEKAFCEACYIDILERCSVCSQPIMDRILRATGKAYHPQCFTCVVCHKSLDGVPFTVDATNQIHCIDDFHKQFAPRCSVCHEAIMPEPGQEETVRIVALDRSFHVHCYKCEDCGLLLSSENEGQGCYPLDSHILCRNCNARRIQALSANITTDL
uniref:lipoma-preferred partner homolog isoform X3 n=1 Tax=Myxine glutinosa TaxID=7769 RepID=UPI00358EDD9C